MKLGQASVEDPAANALMVTTGAGAAPLVDAPAPEIAKAYDPNEPRDARGRWTNGPYGHGETPKAQAKPAGVQVAAEDAGATMFLGFMAAAAAMVAAGNAVRDALDRHKSRNEPPPPVPSSKPRDEKEDNPTAPPVSQTPAAAPASPPPEEPDERGEGESERRQSKKRFEVPNREPSPDNPEDFKLGWDPKTKRFRPNEVRVGWRLQEKLQLPLERDFVNGGDWIDPDGIVYDAVGPVPPNFFKADTFNASIDSHLLKSGVISVIDLTGLSADQIAQVESYVSRLPLEAQARIIKIGF